MIISASSAQKTVDCQGTAVGSEFLVLVFLVDMACGGLQEDVGLSGVRRKCCGITWGGILEVGFGIKSRRD